MPKQHQGVMSIMLHLRGLVVRLHLRAAIVEPPGEWGPPLHTNAGAGVLFLVTAVEIAMLRGIVIDIDAVRFIDGHIVSTDAGWAVAGGQYQIHVKMLHC